MQTSAEASLVPFLLYLLAAVGTVAGALVLGWLLGGRSTGRHGHDEPFESGVVPAHATEDVRFPVHFYLVALFFVIFDLEAVYLYAWAVAFPELGWRGWLGAAGFVFVLLVALLYELRSGALEWGSRPGGGGSGTRADGHSDARADAPAVAPAVAHEGSVSR